MRPQAQQLSKDFALHSQVALLSPRWQLLVLIHALAVQSSWSWLRHAVPQNRGSMPLKAVMHTTDLLISLCGQMNPHHGQIAEILRGFGRVLSL